MATEALPNFRYYRNPLADDTIQQSSAECAACGRARGFIVTSIAYGPEILDDARFCPWCVEDGSAHRRFGATFNQVDAGASEAATDEVEQRTPGILTWQDWYWPTHCDDVGVYLGQPSGDELRANREAYDALLADIGRWDWGRDADYVHDFIDGLGGTHVAYLFGCPRCGRQLVRWDAD